MQAAKPPVYSVLGQWTPAILLLATLLQTWIGSSCAASARAAGTLKLAASSVSPPSTSRAGGIIGSIPIGYIDTSDGRNGGYYLPKGWENKALPVLVMLHGSRQSGNTEIRAYMGLADKYKFIIIAPSSHKSKYWFAPQRSSSRLTSDIWHSIACYEYVQKLSKVKFDEKKILIGGFSRGGHAAVSLATRITFATHAMATHSAFTPASLGTHLVPIFVSTGYSDPLYTPERVKKAIAYASKQISGLDVTLKLFSGGHSQANTNELKAGVQWWLGDS